MRGRSLTCLVFLVAIGGLCTASAARSEHVPGATYTGPLSGGRTVAFTVSADGSYVTSFTADYLAVGCGTSLTGTWTDLALIVNDTFSHPAEGDGDISFSGTFTGIQSATGTVAW